MRLEAPGQRPAQQPIGLETLQRQETLAEAILKHRNPEPVMFCCRISHPFGVDETTSHRFFADDMLSRPERLQ